MGESFQIPSSIEPSRFAPGTRVVHVGPHKTGTTAIQAALHAARNRLPEHGVWMPSDERNPVEAVKAGVRPRRGNPHVRDWEALVDAFGATGDRIGILSSEYFADADAPAARRIVDQLGGDRVHILVTLRPLAKILPSQWQQHVQSSLARTYEEWLGAVLREDPDDPAVTRFWHRHRHDRFVRRWAEAVGTENVSAIVVDDSRPDRLLRDFEALLGLPDQTLQPSYKAANRSLTAAEIELVRRCAALWERRGWSKTTYRDYIRYGLAPRIKTHRKPPPDEPRIATPRWAIERTAEFSESIAKGVAASGVRVIGDLDRLRRTGTPADPVRTRIEPEVYVQAVLGCVAGAVRKRQLEHGSGPFLRLVRRRVLGQRGGLAKG